MITKYPATIIASIIAAICFALSGTFSFTFMTVMPIALPLEIIFTSVFDSYAAISGSTTLGLLAVFTLLGIWFIRQIQKDRKAGKKFNYLRLLVFFAIQQIILHPLIFSIWPTMNAHRAGDGQFIMGFMETFQVSSLAFVVLGIIIDSVKNHKPLPYYGQ